MLWLRLLLKNAFRHRLRAALTILGLVVAIASFGLLRTIVDAWYAGVKASSSARLIVRSATSLVIPLPLAYAERLRAVEGVTAISWSNWFGGVYVEPRNFFPQFAVDARSYLPLYPEFVLPEDQKLEWLRDRRGVVVGRTLADKFGWKLGDTIALRGTIYSGTWTFTLRGIFDGAESGTDTGQMLMHWQYVNETMRAGGRAGDAVGVYVVGIREPENAPLASARIDAQFRNSRAETLTETEQAFQLGFVAMSEAILLALQAVSYIVVVIILAVMANTVAMGVRERASEYATLKAVGFGPPAVAALVAGESLVLALAGGLVAVALTLPLAAAFAGVAGSLFPVFLVSRETIALQLAVAAAVGLLAAAWPAWRMGRLDIVAGLRQIA
jgi:putative ABC transport system permease protein